jgi:hypothetical protein
MDTTLLEYVAEDLISHRLQQGGLLVAKPKFDQQGTDLLTFAEVGDGVKFCRIQCKGRSVANARANVKIPEAYVTNGFVVFLYVESDPYSGDLYCFLANDVRSWNKNRKNEYTLRLSKRDYKSKLVHWLFDSGKIELIRDLIQRAEASGEFRHLIHGTLNVTLDAAVLVATGTSAPRQEGA